MKINNKFILPGIITLAVICIFVMYTFQRSRVGDSTIILKNIEQNTDEVFTTILSEDIIENDNKNKGDIKIIQQKTRPTNEGEQKADEKKKEEMIEAFKSSKYSSCDEIISDYIERLESLKKGNMKPFGEFPLSTDPTIKYCQKTNAEFRKKLDSLENIGNEILAVKLKEFN